MWVGVQSISQSPRANTSERRTSDFSRGPNDVDHGPDVGVHEGPLLLDLSLERFPSVHDGLVSSFEVIELLLLGRPEGELFKGLQR